MRQSFAHEAVLTMAEEADLAAPGAAVTLALCGSWDHEPPCPLAPHHTSAVRMDRKVRVRTLFATEPARESEVRALVERALASGSLVRPDGVATGWELDNARPQAVAADEHDHARRLVQT